MQAWGADPEANAPLPGAREGAQGAGSAPAWLADAPGTLGRPIVLPGGLSRAALEPPGQRRDSCWGACCGLASQRPALRAPHALCGSSGFALEVAEQRIGPTMAASLASTFKGNAACFQARQQNAAPRRGQLQVRWDGQPAGGGGGGLRRAPTPQAAPPRRSGAHAAFVAPPMALGRGGGARWPPAARRRDPPCQPAAPHSRRVLPPRR